MSDTDPIRRPKAPRGPGGNSRPARRPEDVRASARPKRVSRQNQVESSQPKKKGFALTSLTFSLRAVIASAVVVVAALVTVPVALQWADQAREHQAAIGELEEAKATRAELEKDLANWDNKEYIASQARSRLGLVEKGETQFSVADAPQRQAEKEAEDKRRGPERPWTMVVQEELQEADIVSE